jgi:hypothetical protein
MKKKIAIMLMVLLSGCAEKQEYEAAVLEQMKTEKDLKDYKIAPEEMAKCVVQTSSKDMPGLFLVDPDRLTAYKNYTKMLKLMSSQDPKKALEELRVEFSSAKGLADAHSNFTESYMECISGLVTNTEQELVNKDKQPQ